MFVYAMKGRVSDYQEKLSDASDRMQSATHELNYWKFLNERKYAVDDDLARQVAKSSITKYSKTNIQVLLNIRGFPWNLICLSLNESLW